MAYRIALLVDSLTVSKYVKELVDWAESQANLEVCGLVIHSTPQNARKGFSKFIAISREQGFYTAVSRAVFAGVVRIESLLSMRSDFLRKSLSKHNIGDRVSVHVVTSPEVSASDFALHFSDEDLQKIEALRPDALIRCGNGILKGRILSLAKHGVISIHHADNRVQRGGPAGFWEVLERRPYTGFNVQRTNEEPDGGEVLFRGSVGTDLLYLRNRANLYERANASLMKTIKDVLDQKCKFETDFIYDHRFYKNPKLHETVQYVIQTVGLIGYKVIRKVLGFRWHWGVGYCFGHWSKAVLWRAKTIPNPPGHFLADPFAFEHDGEHYVFVEDYIYSAGKAVISVYKVTPAGSERLGIALEEPFHLSFPFLFRYESRIYMVPESVENRNVRLYRATAFPLRWELADVLLSDIKAVDSIVFPKGGRWHMLTTIMPNEATSNDAELSLFSSDNPLRGWHPHPSNPVVMDASKGRNGGLLTTDTDLYRVGQRRGFLQYGKAMAIYRIDNVDENYSETKIQDIEPLFQHGVRGTHHIHHDGNLTVFDYVKNARPR